MSEPKPKDKSFAISKWVVWDAYQRVKANDGASQPGEWTEGVLGALVFLSPWLLGFAGLTMMAWSAWIVGVLAVILTASVLLTDRSPQRVAAQH